MPISRRKLLKAAFAAGAAGARLGHAGGSVSVSRPPAAAPGPSPVLLPLGAGLVLAIDEAVLEVRDRGKAYLSDGGAAFAKREPQSGDAVRPDYAFILGRFSAGRVGRGSQAELQEILSVRVVATHTRDALTMATVLALYPGGDREEWTIGADRRRSTWSWSRRPGRNTGDLLVYSIELPRREMELQFWQTASGTQIVNQAVPGVVEGAVPAVVEVDQGEVLYYTVFGKNNFRLAAQPAGALRIDKEVIFRDPQPGDPAWELDARGKIHDLIWRAGWTVPLQGAQSRLDCSWGAIAAARDFVGFKHLEPPDASADFGYFYAQVFLAALPLTLRKYPGGLVAPRCNVLIAEVAAYKDTWSRDNTWNFEFLYRVDPRGVAGLAADYLDWRLLDARSYSHAGDDADAEVLLLAGRQFSITGDTAFVRKHLERYRQIAHRLLGLRPAGSSLPVFNGSWDGQGYLVGQEPYTTAECYAGLLRLAMMERAAGDPAMADQWQEAAVAMKAQALRDFRDGGLWHGERGTFINYTDYRDPLKVSAREQSWGKGEIQQSGVPRPEFALYETLVPIWLGMLDDETRIRRAFEWIDQHYDYASGHGDVAMPPHSNQTFMLLLDACIRKKYALPKADTLLQTLVDRAFDGGIPFPERAFGTMTGAGPENPGGQYKFFDSTHSGRTWDNAPYFGLTMYLHYGLDYSSDGWSLRTPQPLAGYSLTRLADLRHRDALYTLRWTGRGVLQNVRVDGELLHHPVLDRIDGHHEVEITLG